MSLFMVPLFSLLAPTLLACISIILCARVKRGQTKMSFPPGPPANVLVGNILKMSPKAAWYKLTEYKATYGDLVFFHGLGNHVLILNSMDRILDLLEKRATIYSDRPIFTMASELMGLGQSMPMLAYNDEWRLQRKLAHAALGPGAVKKYHDVQEDLAALLAKQLLDAPTEFFSHVRLTASRIILSVTYGISVEEAESEYIAHAEDTMEMISEVTVPGAFLCDLWPWMKHLPEWLPFQKTAAHGRHMIERLVSKPLEHVKEQMNAGTATPSLVQDLLLMDADDRDTQERRVKWTAGCLYGAGGETTYTTVLVFLAAMALHPDIQRRAQDEVDNTVGVSALPRIQDRDRLPFVNAVIKETMRWHPALPLGIARQTAKEDRYEGFTIPKGTVVIPNVWAIAFETHGVHDPQEFVPERFMGPEPALDPTNWAFGFARRLCPGKHLAENSVFILIATILSAFDVTSIPGKPIDLKYSTGLVSYPLPFECHIEPRSDARAQQVAWRAAQRSGV